VFLANDGAGDVIIMFPLVGLDVGNFVGTNDLLGVTMEGAWLGSVV
jgi:hypothetical protein